MTNTNGRSLLSHGATRAAFALTVVLFCTAPTPGDIGSCGKRVQPLDPSAFFEDKKLTDCRRCRECEFDTDFCKDACDDEIEAKSEFLEGCLPIVHDGVVCLNALDAASCSDYEEFVRDKNRKAPNECRFCPWEAP